MSLLVSIEAFLIRRKRYKILLIYSLVFPIFLFLRWVFSGLYVGVINLLGKDINYLYFLIVSEIFVSMVDVGGIGFLDYIVTRGFKYMLILKGYFSTISYFAIREISDNLIFYLVILTIVFLFFSKSIFVFLLSIPLSFLLLIPAYAYSFLYSIILMFVRGEDFIKHLSLYASLYGYFLVPTTFSYLYFPQYQYLEYIPAIGMFEELRRFVLTGTMNLVTFFVNLLESIVLLVIGYILFVRTINYLRYKGWIFLT